MRLVAKVVTKLFEYAVVLAMAGVTVILFVNVFLRYVLHSPFSWAEEISVLLLVWIVFLGAGLVQSRNDHVAITYLFDPLPRRGKRLFLIFGNLVVCAVLVVHLVASFQLLKVQMHSSMMSLRASMTVFALAPLVGIGGLLFFTLNLILKELREKDGKRGKH
jgi:TRAP-type C4-dicarboxylate transport system permease small subunit